MAAQAKQTVHALKPADVIADTPNIHPVNPSSQHNLPPRQEGFDRRRLNVSEKLAEGRGFWRGVFIGAAFGAAAGVAGTVAVATVWVPLVLDTVQQASMITTLHAGSSVVDGAPLTVTPTGQAAATEALPQITPGR